MPSSIRSALSPLASFITACAVCASTLFAVGTARADEDFDVAITPGKVTVTAKGSWHINKAYPWKLTIGDKKITQGEFVLSEKSAVVSAPKGEGKLKGGVCNGDQCRMIQVEVKVP
jgi:hypothetical protein